MVNQTKGEQFDRQIGRTTDQSSISQNSLSFIFFRPVRPTAPFINLSWLLIHHLCIDSLIHRFIHSLFHSAAPLIIPSISCSLIRQNLGKKKTVPSIRPSAPGILRVPIIPSVFVFIIRSFSVGRIPRSSNVLLFLCSTGIHPSIHIPAFLTPNICPSH